MPRGGRAALARAGAVALREVPELGLAVVRAPRGRGLAEAAADLERAGAAWAEPNYTFRLDFVPNDPSYAQQSPYLDRIDAAGAWEFTQGRAEVVVAILDTGVYTGHVDLRDGIWTNPGEIPGNGIDDERNGFVDDVHGWDFADNENEVLDDYGHGTHVAGIAAARIDNGIGMAGVAGRATIMPVDVFGGGIGTYEDLIRAIVYATDNGARVINMSLGASSYSLGEEAAVEYAHSRGVVLVAAAGNSGREELHYPAAHPRVIAVASTQADDGLSIFSTRGDFVDVAAPGTGIYSTLSHGGYGGMSGTSMATPHVAGLAALILSRNPMLTPDDARAVIESAADDLGPAGRDIYFGHGRINAARSLNAVSGGDELPPPPDPGTGSDLDLPGCQEVVANGGFEDDLRAWEGAGAVTVDRVIRGEGAASAGFPGGPSARSVLTQTLTIPAEARLGVVKFLYRIERRDLGRGTTPEFPFDDWFVVELQSNEGERLAELLRTGNTADTSNSGLEWDEYLYRMTAQDVAVLREQGQVRLVFTAQNDSDSYPTNVWVDGVRICFDVSPVALTYLPLLTSGR
jgi:subtilisin family serine protease